MNPEEIKNKVCEYLSDLGIEYERHDHEPIFTMEEINESALDPNGYIAKNLFLRDNAGRRHMLVTICGGKTPDLKVLRGSLESSRLSFGSEERLWDKLSLTKGSVSPMGLMNDKENLVEFFFDKDLFAKPYIGIHPNHNSATLFLKVADLITAVEKTGHIVKIIEV